MRDSQQAKVYAWEEIAYPGYKTRDRLTPVEARDLVRRVHADVRAAGGAAPRNISIKFTKRNGGEGDWSVVKFSRTHLPLCHVLHEIAHTLTYAAQEVVLPTYVEACIARDQLDAQGHGPKFVACMIALFEKYARRPVAPAVQTARFFKMSSITTRYKNLKTGQGHIVRHRYHERFTKFTSIQIDEEALRYWRNLLASVPA
jgi:hypothetical protein